MTDITSVDGTTVGGQLQNAVMVLVRWASRSGVRTELYGQANSSLSLTDIWLLEAIVLEGPLRATELAAWQGVDKSTVTPQLRRIEQRGLISRRPDPRDNRAALLTATPAGRRLHRKLVATGTRVFDAMLEHWSEEDRGTLGALLARFSAELVARPGGAAGPGVARLIPGTPTLGAVHPPFGIYVHVPFCASRCGYCDFNTYTASELDGSGASPDGWLAAVRQELALAASTVGDRPVDTVFVGGGTPSLIGADRLGEVLGAVRDTFGLAPGAEVTTESNPESTSPEFFDGLVSAGFTRVSLGMQSAAQHVLKVLDRRHTPGRAVAAAKEARAAGLEHVNLDLIYATPGETDDDLRSSLDAVLDAGVDHVSAYSLIVEDGTALARRVARGELPAPDDDVAAARYEMIDDRLSAAGLGWYEVSNWAGSQDAACRHNLGYWLDGDWWGLGPGAHSHLAGSRWWNVKHPARYAARLTAGESPEADREELTDAERHMERVMLRLRLASGLPLDLLDADGRAAAEQAVTDGLLEPSGDRVVLTRRGRLLADGVVQSLLAGAAV